VKSKEKKLTRKPPGMRSNSRPLTWGNRIKSPYYVRSQIPKKEKGWKKKKTGIGKDAVTRESRAE